MSERLSLPDVTLVMVETREHELARLAILDCLKVAKFGDVLILTNNIPAFDAQFFSDCGAYAMGDNQSSSDDDWS